jgi:hypothetical protein
MEIQDAELKKVLGMSGIPKSYQREDASITKCGEAGQRMIDWLKGAEGYHTLRKGVAVVEIVSDSIEATDTFYCAARACILHAIPVQVLHVQEMLEGSQLAEDVWEKAEGDSVLFIDGLVSERPDDLTGPQKATLEWFLSKWLMDGHSLVFLHARAISASEFASRFKKRVAVHTKLTIANL